MRITSTAAAGVTELAVFGEVDLATADELFAAGTKALSADCAALRIDLAGVTFMDSTGLAALVKINNQAAGRPVLIQNPRPNVLRVFEVTALDKVFGIEWTDPS
jgi:anti-sigma B factor antagonist